VGTESAGGVLDLLLGGNMELHRRSLLIFERLYNFNEANFPLFQLFEQMGIGFNWVFIRKVIVSRCWANLEADLVGFKVF